MPSPVSMVTCDLAPGRTRTLDSHASRLRKKLAEHSGVTWIVNVWGVGYRLRRP